DKSAKLGHLRTSRNAPFSLTRDIGYLTNHRLIFCHPLHHHDSESKQLYRIPSFSPNCTWKYSFHRFEARLISTSIAPSHRSPLSPSHPRTISHDSVWFLRSRKFGKGSRQWFVFLHSIYSCPISVPAGWARYDTTATLQLDNDDEWLRSRIIILTLN